MTNYTLHREEPRSRTQHLRQVPNRQPRCLDTSPSIRSPLLVRQGGNVLAAVRLVPLLGRMADQLPSRAAGKCEHCIMAAGMHGHGDTCRRAGHWYLGSGERRDCDRIQQRQGQEDEGGAYQGAREEGVVDIDIRRPNNRASCIQPVSHIIVECGYPT